MFALILACAGPPTADLPPCADCFGGEDAWEPRLPVRAVERVVVTARPDLAGVFSGESGTDWYEVGDTDRDRWRVYVHVRGRAPLWLEVDRAAGSVVEIAQPWDPAEPASSTATSPVARAAAARRASDVDELVAALHDPAWIVRSEAAVRLFDHRDAPRAFLGLLRWAFEGGGTVMDRWIRARVLTAIPGGIGAVSLRDALCDPEPAIRWTALMAIGPHRDNAWVEPWMDDADPAVATLAAAIRTQTSDRLVWDVDRIWTPETAPTHPILAQMPTCTPTDLSYRLVIWSPAVAHEGLTATFTTEAGALDPLRVPVDLDGVAILDVPVSAGTRMRSVTLRAGGTDQTWTIPPRGAARVAGLCQGPMPGGGGTEIVDGLAWHASEWREDADCRAAAIPALPTLPMEIARVLARTSSLPAEVFDGLIAAPRSDADRVALLRARLSAGSADAECARIVALLGGDLDPDGVGECTSEGPLTSAALARSGADPVKLLRLLDPPDRAPTEALLARRVLAGDEAALQALKPGKARGPGPVAFPTPVDGITGFFEGASCDEGPESALVVDKALVLPRGGAIRLPLRDVDVEAIDVVLCAGRVRWRRSR